MLTRPSLLCRIPTIILLLACLIPAITACRGHGINENLGSEPDVPRGSISQLVLLESPAPSQEPDDPVPAFTPEFGSEDNRFTSGEHIRVIELRQLSQDMEARVDVVALDMQGGEQWRLSLPFTGAWAPWIEDEEALLAADGWFFILDDWSDFPEEYDNQITAISPAGEIAWTAVAECPPEDLRWEKFTTFFLGQDEELVAIDNNGVLYQFARDGSIEHFSSMALDQINTRMSLSHNFNGNLTYLFHKLDGYSKQLYLSRFEPLPEYFSTGVSPGNPAVILTGVNDDSTTFDTESKITCAHLRNGGGIYFGGYAGELSAFDEDGSQLWRVVPDQKLVAEHVWEANEMEHWPDWSFPTYVASIVECQGGTVVASTACGTLYAAGPGGDMLWVRPNATGVPKNTNGYGLDVHDFDTKYYSTLSVDGSGNIICSCGGQELTVDPDNGHILNVESPTRAEHIVETHSDQLRLCYGYTVFAADRNGSIGWRCDLPDRISARPALGPGDTLLVPTACGFLHQVDAGGGIAWSVELPGQVNSAPAVDDLGNAYVVDRNGVLSAISTTGGLLWSQEGYNTQNLTPAICSTGVVVQNAEGVVVCLDPAGGEVWRYDFGLTMLAPAAVSPNGNIGFATEGKVVKLSPTGKLLFEYQDQIYRSGWGEMRDLMTRIVQPPVFLPDDSMVVEFNDYPSYSDVSPIGSSGTVKCLSSSGIVKWELVDKLERFAWNGGPTPPRYLISPLPLRSGYVVTAYEGEYKVFDTDGLVCTLEFPDDAMSPRSTSKDIFASHRNGVYLSGKSYRSALRQWIYVDAAWLEFDLP